MSHLSVISCVGCDRRTKLKVPAWMPKRILITCCGCGAVERAKKPTEVVVQNGTAEG